MCVYVYTYIYIYMCVYIYIKQNHFAIYLKLTQYCKSAIFNEKKE